LLDIGKSQLTVEALVSQQSSGEDELAQGRIDSDGLYAGPCGGQQVLTCSAA
jgi:hypothetical protein